MTYVLVPWATLAFVALFLALGACVGLRLPQNSAVATALLGFAALGIFGMATFWVFYLFPAAAPTLVAVGLTALLLSLVTYLGRNSHARHAVLTQSREFLVPAALVLTATYAVVGLAFLYGGGSDPLLATAARYFPSMPPDNQIGLIFADALAARARPIPDPLYDVWQASSRTPLLAALMLGFRSVVPGSASPAGYEAFATTLQVLLIGAAWLVLRYVGLSRRIAAFTTLCLAVSGPFIINSTFVWPKLFAATGLLLIVGIAFSEHWSGWRSSAVAGGMVGLGAAASYLVHEGVMLALLAIVLTLVVTRRLPSVRFLVAAAAAWVLLVAGWWVFQWGLYPPGDQVLHFQLAGRLPNPNPGQSLLANVRSAYGELSWVKLFENKRSNFTFPFTEVIRQWLTVARFLGALLTGNRGEIQEALATLRWNWLFYLVTSIGILAVAPMVLVGQRLLRRTRVVRVPLFARNLAIYLGLSYLTWALILFGPRFTMIHQGPLLLFVALLTVAVVCTFIVWPRAAPAICISWSALVLLVYLLPPPTSLPVWTGVDPTMVILLLLGVIGFPVTLVAAVRGVHRRGVAARPAPTDA